MECILKKYNFKKRATIILFVLPTLILLSIFWIFPMIEAILISFTDWDYMSSEFRIIGFKNYENIFKDKLFYEALKNTFVFTVGTLIPTIVCGLLLAILLKKNNKKSLIYKSIIFSPWITPTVAISIVWSWIFEPRYGLANYILELLKLPKSEFLQSSATSMMCVIIVTVWKSIGYAMVFYLNALEKIPKEIYEAADVDGAGKFIKLKSITIPLISPTTFFLSIIIIINSMQAYDQIQVLTQGGPSGSTRTLLYLYYQKSFENFNIGEATALATIILLIVGLISIIQFLVSKKWVYNS